MFRPWTLFVGLRYAYARHGSTYISVISFISVIGIALGVTALITVLSVMNGFESELRSRILGMTSHATIQDAFQSELHDADLVQQKAQQHPRVVGVAPYIQGEGMFRNGRYFSGGLMRGVDPAQEPSVSSIGDSLTEGEFTDLVPGEFGVILGDALAEVLWVGVGDKVDLLIPQASVTAAGVMPRFRRFTVVGLFHVDMYEYDRSMALIHIKDAQKLYKMQDGVSGVRLMLDDMFQAPVIARDLVADLGTLFRVTDWTQRHENFFRAIATEKTVMFFILLIIIIVAAFNILSTQVMVITEKRGDIAILKTLGASTGDILKIFLIQGSLVGFFGTAIGLICGISLALNVDVVVPWLEQVLGQSLLPSDIYVISQLKGELHMNDVLKTAIAAFSLSILFALFPAWSASRVQPAEALRHE